MKLLLAVICIAIVGTVLAGITLEQIQKSEFRIVYKLKISYASEELNGYYNFSCSRDFYSTEDSPTIKLFVNQISLIYGLQIPDEDKTTATIESGATSYLNPGSTEIQTEIDFVLDTYMLHIPAYFQNASALKVAEKVRVFAEQSGSCLKDENVEGVVVRLDNDWKYVKITMPNAKDYKQFSIKTLEGTQICQLEGYAVGRNTVLGPFAAFQIKVEQGAQ